MPLLVRFRPTAYHYDMLLLAKDLLGDEGDFISRINGRLARSNGSGEQQPWARCTPAFVFKRSTHLLRIHYSNVIMGAKASQITSLTIVYSTVNSGADQRIYQSSASLVFERGIHRWPVNSPHKWPVTQKIFPFDDVIVRRVQMVWATKTLRSLN